MFKFSVGQQVWYMFENKMCSTLIGARMLCEVDPEFAKTRPGNAWTPKLVYVTIHGSWYENSLFASMGELFDHLAENAIITLPVAKG